MWSCTYVCIVCMCIGHCICIALFNHVCNVCIYIYLHIYIYTYVHIYIYTCICACVYTYLDRVYVPFTIVYRKCMEVESYTILNFILISDKETMTGSIFWPASGCGRHPHRPRSPHVLFGSGEWPLPSTGPGPHQRCLSLELEVGRCCKMNVTQSINQPKQ